MEYEHIMNKSPVPTKWDRAFVHGFLTAQITVSFFIFIHPIGQTVLGESLFNHVR
jgi:hypothetical protein